MCMCIVSVTYNICHTRKQKSIFIIIGVRREFDELEMCVIYTFSQKKKETCGYATLPLTIFD